MFSPGLGGFLLTCLGDLDFPLEEDSLAAPIVTMMYSKRLKDAMWGAAAKGKPKKKRIKGGRTVTKERVGQRRRQRRRRPKKVTGMAAERR